MGLGGRGTTLPTGGMPSCARAHVQPCTPETRMSPCPCGGLQVVPCESMRFGTARTHVGMDVQGAGCVFRDVPMQTW